MSLDVGHSLLQTPLVADSETIDSAADRRAQARFVAVIAARDEAASLAATIAGVQAALPHARVWVADDGSRDASAQIAADAGAQVVRSARATGKGGAVTAAAYAALQQEAPDAAQDGRTLVFVLCDGDLAGSARELGALAHAVAGGEADLAVGAFARRVGGGVGLAQGFARWAIRRRCGLRTSAPISGQRALSARALADVLPFAAGYGMEIGMTIDAVRAGHRVLELQLALEHRASGRTPAGFAHRARQLVDFARVYAARRSRPA